MRFSKLAPFATPLVLGSITAAVLAAASDAGAEPLRLRPGFSPHPLLTQQLKARVDDTRVYDRGWKQCDPGGGAFTTREPLLTWEVGAPMPLRIRLENELGDPSGSGGVIVMPDGSYLCDQKGSQFFMKSWPSGRYQLYLYGQSIGVSAIVRFEDPTRSERELADAVARLPKVTMGDDGAINPRHQEVPATVAVDAGDAGPTCAKGRRRVMPLARLEVTRASSWYVASGRQELFVITADQKCVDPTEAPSLPVGTHTLWTIIPIPGRSSGPPPGPAASYPLEIDDRAAPLTLPPAETRDVGALDAPLVIAGAVRPAERWYARRGACGGAARAPDLYLRSDRPLQKVALSLLWARAPQRLHVMGPLEERKPTSQPRCADRDDGEQRFDILEGTYAVWIGGDDKAAGTDYHLLVLRDGLDLDAMTTLAPIPEELSLSDRAIKNHYPYFRSGAITAWTPLWTQAPDQLFIYTRAEVKTDRATLPPGEPLLVAWSSRDRTSAYRYDGTNVAIDTRLVAETRPAQVVLPSKPDLPNVTSLSAAIDRAGPEDAKGIAAFRKVDDKFTGCLGDYLARHDPTWGKNHDVYRISGDRVVNVGDQVAAAGARKCGEGKVTSARRSLEKQLAKTRAARYQRHLAAVRKRFGL